MSYALNLRTLELKKYGGKREGADDWKARHGADWLTGTIDWVGTHKGLPWIDDFKTGKWKVEPTIKQIVSYGLYLWVEAGCPGNYRLVRSVTQWPKYRLDAPPARRFGPLMTALELEEHLDDLRYAIDHPNEVNPVPIDTGLDSDGEPAPFDPTRKLSPCAFCECREPMPAAEWMNNYRFRAMPHCLPGMLKRLETANG